MIELEKIFAAPCLGYFFYANVNICRANDFKRS